MQFEELDVDVRTNIEKEFTEEEIEVALMDCNGDKAPGLDGFNMRFLQDFWLVVKTDLMHVFKDFHSLGSFVKSLNSTFLVLVTKKERVKKIKNFRLLSLVEAYTS